MRKRSSCRVLPALWFLFFTAHVHAQVIDFETDGGGAPSGATIASDEYAGLGVLIEDSEVPAGLSTLIDTNPANVGTPIDGKYVNVGGFTGVDTFLELMFPAGTTSLGFHWATGVDATQIEVALFDSSDTQIGATILDPATTTFVNNAGFTVPAGTFSAATGTPIHRALIEDETGTTRGLILDNLRFQQIPEPVSLTLAVGGAIACVATRRSKREHA